MASHVQAEQSSNQLKEAMRRLVTGVTVVTVPIADGMTGFTASSFTSVSLDPPLVLVCVSCNSRSYNHIKNTQSIAIHILGDDQANIAKAFSLPGNDRSKICNWSISSLGNPVLDSYLSVLECTIHNIQEAGDHAIIIGRVDSINEMKHDSGPLVYHQGKMFAMPPQAGKD